MNRITKKLNEQNNMLDEKINEENQEMFTNMICYLRGANISEYDVEVVRQDLTEMILSAQKRGESIDSVIGGDYKEFCDEVIANIPPKTKKQRLIEGLDISCWGLSILFLIKIVISKDTIIMIKNMIDREPVSLKVSVSIGGAISIALIIILANLIVNFIIKNSFRKEGKHENLVVFIIGVVIFSILSLLVWLGKETLFTINIFTAIFISIILFLGHKLFGNYV